jgi:RNA polymerase sigma factor (sigma-70 family)
MRGALPKQEIPRPDEVVSSENCPVFPLLRENIRGQWRVGVRESDPSYRAQSPTPDHPIHREIQPVETDPDPTSDGSVTQLIDRFRSGSPDSCDEAARRLWERYLPRLLRLARRHLDRRIRVLQDEEDVVQSMGRSFFKRLRRGDFDLTDRDALWALLVTITLNKARNTTDHHFAARRDVRRRLPLPPSDGSRSDAPHEAPVPEAAEPTPAEADALNEALERRLRDLPEPDLRQVALLKLEGSTNREIAEALQCGERSVERKLNLIRKRWEAAGEDPD